jgi:hypothetical protein
MRLNEGDEMIKIWMKENDACMFINEAPEGGFSWDFLDYKPDNDQEYRELIVCKPKEITALKSQIEKLEKRSCEDCANAGDVYCKTECLQKEHWRMK